MKFDENTDYILVEAEVKTMFSDLVASKCSCSCKGDVECKITTLLTAIAIDKGVNDSRWKTNLRVAYKLLKGRCGC